MSKDPSKEPSKENSRSTARDPENKEVKADLKLHEEFNKADK